MAKKMYAGIDGKARKIKKLYGGIDGKARKIRKGYAGIGGVARPFWTGGGVEYYGEIRGFPIYQSYLAATTVGPYALFGGGGRNTVDAYIVA